MTEYDYYEKEGAYFRKRKSLRMPAVEHVRHGHNWVPYEGDNMAPVSFGNRVTEAEATAGMKEHRHAAE